MWTWQVWYKCQPWMFLWFVQMLPAYIISLDETPPTETSSVMTLHNHNVKWAGPQEKLYSIIRKSKWKLEKVPGVCCWVTRVRTANLINSIWSRDQTEVDPGFIQIVSELSSWDVFGVFSSLGVQGLFWWCLGSDPRSSTTFQRFWKEINSHWTR